MSDPHFSSVVLLSGFEGSDGSMSFTDESSYSHTMVGTNDAQIDTDQFMFGSSALLCDGSGDGIRINDADEFSFGSDPFTIEAFVRPADTNGFVVCAKYTDSPVTAEWTFNWNGTNLVFIGFYGTGASNFVQVAGAATLNVGSWHHVAVDRSGNTWRTYLDGSVVASLSEARTLSNKSTPLLIGIRTHTTPLPLNGHMDELRITKGVARYAGAYSVPTSAFFRS